MKSGTYTEPIPTSMSLPSRERGLKYQRKEDKLWTVYVAPFAGAWIEICFLLSERTKVHIVAPFAGAWIEITKEKRMLAELLVAPFAGAWIEIHDSGIIKVEESVAPFAGAWIEIKRVGQIFQGLWVAPFAGAWIEIMTLHHIRSGRSRRSLRGSVD